MLKNEQGITEFASHSFGIEFSELTLKKIRILCERNGKKCRPLRYEIEPFTEDTTAPDWILKKIPKYVTRGEFAFNPQVTPDGNKMFWTTLVRPQGSTRSTQKIWTSEKDEYGFWKQGWQMETPLNNKMPSAVISALPGGNELFVFGNFGETELLDDLKLEMDQKSAELVKNVQSRKEFEYKINKLKSQYQEKSEKIFNRAPLYKSNRDNNYWTAPKPILFPSFYNLYRKPENPNQQIFGGSALSSSGKTLIFSAQQNSNYGKLDLYVSFMDSNGIFGDGINLGANINTTEEEMAPFLAPDDRTLYFSSNGHGKDLSIYFTKRIGNGWNQWSKPEEISTKLRGVNFFSIPASSEWAYVSREGELFLAKIPENFRPEPVVVVQGVILDHDNKPLSAEIRYESLNQKKILGKGISDPNTGKFSIILPYGDNYGFFAEKDGYLPVSKNLNLTSINIPNSNNKKPLESTYEVVLNLPKIEKGREITLNNLFFELGSAEISKESEPELNRIAIILKEMGNLQIILEGHTDDIGQDDTNLTLSELRAKAVKEHLVRLGGLDPGRIDTVGYGEGKPIVKNDSEENRSKNRRVVFRIR
ncbi:OmpA family protein [Leptospira sp. GIMC2001]|nr:OmpA family protein [Leptospira sp. GIMC2001]WCL50415.1 OmpA family protein [Leptospira sp. GIMC2001]